MKVEIDGVPYSYTQPVCDPCFTQLQPGTNPVRLVNPDSVMCCMCGLITGAGIFVRIDPRTVRYPRAEGNTGEHEHLCTPDCEHAS